MGHQQPAGVGAGQSSRCIVCVRLVAYGGGLRRRKEAPATLRLKQRSSAAGGAHWVGHELHTGVARKGLVPHLSREHGASLPLSMPSARLQASNMLSVAGSEANTFITACQAGWKEATASTPNNVLIFR